MIKPTSVVSSTLFNLFLILNDNKVGYRLLKKQGLLSD